MTISRLIPFTMSLLLFVCASATAKKVDVRGAAQRIVGSPQQVLSYCRVDLAQAKAVRHQLLQKSPKNEPTVVLDKFDTLLLLTQDILNRSASARGVLPDTSARNSALTCEQEAAAFLADIQLDSKIYRVLSSLKTNKLDPTARYVLAGYLREYRRNGIEKDAATQALIRKLKADVVKINQEFGGNIAEDVRTIEFDPSELAGLPEDYLASHPPNENGKVTVSNSPPEFSRFMLFAANSKTREAYYRMYTQKAYPINVNVLSRLFKARYELAKLLGYQDWADYNLEPNMADSKQDVAAFIEKIAEIAKQKLPAENDLMLAVKKGFDPTSTTIETWDVWGRNGGYLTEQARKSKFKYDAQGVRPYLEYSRVRQGLMDITSKMYGISFRAAPKVRVWDKQVEAFDVYEGNRQIARIYFDMFSRKNKNIRGQTDSLALGKKGLEIPELMIVCNFQRPEGQPALLTYDELLDFFHEFGHLTLRIFSGQNPWLGPSVEFDYGEVESYLMEEWARAPEILQSFARHFQTNEPIPLEMVQRITRAYEFGKCYNSLRLLAVASASLDYYAGDPSGRDINAVWVENWNKFSPTKHAQGTHFYTQFGHLYGYSAAYYTYEWSFVVAKDVLGAFREKGLLNPQVAASYRHSMLQPRGTKPAAEQISGFLGRPFSTQAFQNWLESD